MGCVWSSLSLALFSIYQPMNGCTGSSRTRTNSTRGVQTEIRVRNACCSEGSLSRGHCFERLEHDVQIEQQRPVLYVVEVKPQRLLPSQRAASADLPQTGQPGFHQEAAVCFVCVARHFAA